MYNDAKSRRSPGTGDWLLASDEFIRWKGSACQLLWLFGVGARICSMFLRIKSNADPMKIQRGAEKPVFGMAGHAFSNVSMADRYSPS